jgi:hypothetical protein
MMRLIDPVLADLQSEDASARNRGNRWRARGARAAGIFAFWKVLALHASRQAMPVCSPSSCRASCSWVVAGL